VKILLFIDSLGSGGAQRQMVELALGFKEKGLDVSFLTYHNLNFFKSQLGNDISVETIIEPNYIKRILKIRKYIRKNNFNAVISFLSGPCFISSIATFPCKNWKLIVGERSSNPVILKSLKGRAFRYMHFFADFVVANSYANIDMVKKANPFLSSKKCKVIYNIVDLNKWTIDEKYVPYKNDKLNIIVASSHQYLKNFNVLIEGVKLLTKEEHNKLQIDWYGEVLDNSYEDSITKIENYNLKGVFNLYQPTNQIHEKMRGYDVVGLFSFYEGLPNAVCEGMAASKFVIASNVSDNQKLLNSLDFIIDPNNPVSVTQILRKLLKFDKDLIHETGKNNRIKAEKLFDRETILNEYLQLMK
jgi:hypothetical protein